jgi:membrane-bound lytic murein transglycosylase D
VARNRTHGHATDFFHLDLPPETRAYVPGLLALRRLVEDPAAFGLALPAIPDEPYFARVEIDHQLDLGVAADLAGVPRSELLALNPGFKRWATAPDGPQRLLVPAAAAERFARALAELPSDHRLRIVHHRLGRGDTLGTVAARYGISVEALRVANPIDGQRIRPGRLLLIPLSYRANMAAGNPAIPLGGSAPP